MINRKAGREIGGRYAAKGLKSNLSCWIHVIISFNWETGSPLHPAANEAYFAHIMQGCFNITQKAIKPHEHCFD